ncbi:MAG: hypothetical protein KAW17_09650 [Candidatus Eisenbacteria sp.]|nr:hypothetical protein [Candidatus Eisenbacteria bacterium]
MVRESALMTQVRATGQARVESKMVRQGWGWVVSTFDRRVGRQRVSDEMEYGTARQALNDWRVARSLELLGIQNADLFSHQSAGRFERRVSAFFRGARVCLREGTK